MQVFDGRPGDGQAVVGRGAAPDFVKEDERSWGSGIQDGGSLGHLYHKRRAPARQIVAGPDAGEDAVYDREPAFRRRDEAAHLRHDGNERSLAQVSGFASHVGAGHDQNGVR